MHRKQRQFASAWRGLMPGVNCRYSYWHTLDQLLTSPRPAPLTLARLHTCTLATRPHSWKMAALSDHRALAAPRRPALSELMQHAPSTAPNHGPTSAVAQPPPSSTLQAMRPSRDRVNRPATLPTARNCEGQRKRLQLRVVRKMLGEVDRCRRCSGRALGRHDVAPEAGAAGGGRGRTGRKVLGRGVS